jgi:hypothetical protein
MTTDAEQIDHWTMVLIHTKVLIGQLGHGARFNPTDRSDMGGRAKAIDTKVLSTT